MTEAVCGPLTKSVDLNGFAEEEGETKRAVEIWEDTIAREGSITTESANK